MHGKGVYTTSSGTRFETTWAADSSVGNGIATGKDGKRYSATFRDGRLYRECLPLDAK